MSDSIKLNAPIQAHGEQLTELELRRPTAKEARAIRSLPYTMGSEGAINLDLDAATKYIVVCAGIPLSSVDQLDLADLNTLAWKIANFFMTPASTTLEA